MFPFLINYCLMNIKRLTIIFYFIFYLSNAQFDSIPFKTLFGHTAGINTLAYSSKNNILISGSKDETIKCWDIDKLNCTLTYTIPGSSIKKLLLTPTENYLVVSNYRNIYTFNFPEFKISRKKVKIHESYIESMILLNKSKKLVCSSWRGNCIKILDFPSLKNKKTFPEFAWTDCLLSLNDTIFFSASHDNTIKEWNISKMELLSIFSGHTDWIYDLEIDMASNYLFSCSLDKCIKIWDLKNKKNINSLTFFLAPLVKMCLIHEHNILVAGDINGRLYYVDLKDFTLKYSFNAHLSQITDLIYIKTSNNNFLVSSSMDKSIKFWKL